MAYIRKVTTGYRAEVERAGERRSQTFKTKREATEWAAHEESALLDAKRGKYPKRTLREAFKRYAEEVSPKKRGGVKEKIVLEAIAEQFGKTADKVFSEVTTADIAKWRDDRLKVNTAGSVQRRINLIRNVWTVGRKEWLWCGDSPFLSLTMPGQNPVRERRVLPSEVKLICRGLNYITGDVRTKSQETALAFLIGLRTAMRAGEILSLTDQNVDLQRRVARVNHKMQYITGKPREVPLTKHGARLIGYLAGRGAMFSVSSSSMETLFRKTRDRLLIKDLHFHDSRAEALTRLSRRVDVMTLAKISGHKDLALLQSVYYRESAADIARRL